MIKQRVLNLWRIGFIVGGLVLLFFTIANMALWRSTTVVDGQANLEQRLALNEPPQTIGLNGQWEFYWNQLLTPADFEKNPKLKLDSFMKVPDSWSSKKNPKGYSDQGVATYRIMLTYPSTIEDPALRIQNVSCAYKVYVNGKFVAENGVVSDKREVMKEATKILMVDLPRGEQQVELLFQVANLNYAKGGMRQSPIFGSKQVLEREHQILTAFQLLFIGAVLIFGVYYLLLFVLQTQNKSALIFSALCFVTAFRSLIWGEVPIMLFMPNIAYSTLAFINYVTGYNVIPLMVLFIASLYPLDYKPVMLRLVLVPTILFDGLLFTSTQFMSKFTNYLYLLVLAQMIYMIVILIKAVLNRRETAPLMYMAVLVYVLAINLDILHFSGLGVFYDNNMFLMGNTAVIIVMSYTQARQQAKAHQKLFLYNQNLLEADRLKDKIMATELSFLHAQIKPHFLYNALDAIANICEKDGRKAGQLIIDLAIYLRGSLEFNHLDKITTIEKEIEFVETYFNIEQARFGDKIQLVKEIEVPLHLRLPVLILQPLVENAVRHGISKKRSGGTVHIKIEAIDNQIRIAVSDDGVGIEPQKLEMILTTDPIASGVGLLNIHHRLQRLYGTGLEIVSEEGVNTCVRLVIPIN